LISYDNDINAPYILASNPANGSVDVPLNLTMSVTFSEPMQSSWSISYYGIGSTNSQLSWLTDSELQIIFTDPLPSGETITLVFNPSDYDLNFQDKAGNPLAADTVISFETVADIQDIKTIPYQTISIDGVLDDWNNIEPVFTDPAGDKVKNVSGTDIILGYLAVDENYLYLRMDFADGNPTTTRDMIYECAIWADDVPSGGQYSLELRLQGNAADLLEHRIFIGQLIDDQYIEVDQFQQGDFILGSYFLEVRFPLTVFMQYISNKPSYEAVIRAWNPSDDHYDKSARELINIADFL